VEIADKDSVCNHQNLTPLLQSVHIHHVRKGTLAARETDNGVFSCGMDELGRWVKLYEKLMKSAVYQDTHAKSLFIHLLLNAQWQSGVYKAVFQKKEIILKAGQLITGRYRLAQALGESASTVWDALGRLRDRYRICDTESDSKATIISILKWDTYQTKENKSDNQPTTSRQPADTNQEVKKVRRFRNEKEISTQIPDLLMSFSKNGLQEKIKAYLEANAQKNKSKKITPNRQRNLLLELSNSQSRCNDKAIFEDAVAGALKYNACNIGYVNAIIKNKKIKT